MHLGSDTETNRLSKQQNRLHNQERNARKYFIDKEIFLLKTGISK